MSILVQEFKKGLIQILKDTAEEHSAKVGKGICMNDDPLKTAQSYAQASGRYKGLQDAILLIEQHYKNFNKNEEH